LSITFYTAKYNLLLFSVSRSPKPEGKFVLFKRREVKLDLSRDLDEYEFIRRLEKSKIGNDRYKLPKEVRPCISQLLITSVEAGNKRSEKGFFRR